MSTSTVGIQVDMERVMLNCGKLKGEAKFAMWSFDLKMAFEIIDKDYWPILTGELKPPPRGYREPPTQNAARETIAQDRNAANAVTHAAAVTAAAATGQDPPDPPVWVMWWDIDNETTDHWIHTNYTEPNAKVRDWEKKSNTILLLIAHPCEKSLKICIAHGSKTAPEAWKFLTRLYGTPSPEMYAAKVEAWLNCRYRPNGRYRVFLHKWNRALNEVQDVFGPDNKLPQVFIDAVFLAATRDYPARDN